MSGGRAIGWNPERGWAAPVTQADYAVGDIVEYSAGERRRVRVEHKDADIKNGSPGFDGVMVDAAGRILYRDGEPAGVWGYDDQITKIERAVRS